MGKNKFRVWDKFRNKYAEQITSFNFDREGNINLVSYLDKKNKTGVICDSDKYHTNEFVIERCVGLLYDGTEIYKNDIILVPWNGEVWELIVGNCIHDYQVRNDAWTYFSEKAIKTGKLTKNLNKNNTPLKKADARA